MIFFNLKYSLCYTKRPHHYAPPPQARPWEVVNYVRMPQDRIPSRYSYPFFLLFGTRKDTPSREVRVVSSQDVY